MTRRLLVVAGPDRGRELSLSEAEVQFIGRSRSAHHRLQDPRVSRVHCQIQSAAGAVILTDAMSGTGTFVNDERIVRQQLMPGDVIRLGDTQLRLEDRLLEAPVLAGADEVDPTPSIMREAVAALHDPGTQAEAELRQLVGTRISSYEIRSVLARGRSGLVFRGWDLKQDRMVALKVFWPSFAANEENRQRFLRAMLTSRTLRHPNLVTVHGAGKVAQYCWLAMEYVEGESLRHILRRTGVAGRLDWHYAYRIAVHVARALEFAHQQQIIHRNISPANILIRSGDQFAKLGDLMLAKALHGEFAHDVSLTGELVGHLPYLAPEQTYEGSDVDGRADLYALGATLYEILAGQPAFPVTSPAKLVRKIRTSEPERPSAAQQRPSEQLPDTDLARAHVLLQLESIPSALEDMVVRLLAKRREDRYQTATELLAQLEIIGKTQGIAI